MIRIAIAACALAAPSAVGLAAGQGVDATATSDTATFLAGARRAAERYADPARAVADGYVRIGPDGPAMGTHWAHRGIVADGIVDPARPALLAWVEIDGAPVLAGVGYAVVLVPGEPSPRAPPGAAWHDHAGTVDEELLGGSHVTDRARPRVAVLHAWVGIANPDGPFAAENWALPWARLGLAPPPSAALDAARAASLATVGAEWYARLVALVEPAAPEATVRAILTEAGDRVRERLRGLPPGTVVGPGAAEELAGLWARAWDDLGGLPGVDARRLSAARGR